MQLETRMCMGKLLVLIILVCSYLLVSNMDYQDQKQAEKQYCDDIKAGVYPDYKGLKQYCDEVQHASK